MVLSDADRGKLRQLFNEIDSDNDERLTIDEIERAVRSANVSVDNLSHEASAALIMRQADANGDGEITIDEFIDAASYKTNAAGEKTGAFNAFVRHIAENGFVNTAAPNRCNWKQPPVFMVLITVVQISIYIYYASEDDCSNANECPTSFSGPLAYRMCCRQEAWRFITYSVMHGGVAHLVFNVAIQLLVGIPMEMMNGSLRMFLLYLFGVLAGALGSSVFDPDANVVGASGAVYAIIGAWVAEFTQNWDSMEPKWSRWPRAIGMLVIVGLDLGNQVYQRYNGDQNISYTGHFTGFVGGITFGTYILKNIEERPYEIYIRWGGIATYSAGVIFAIFWNIFYTFDKYGLCDDKDTAKCRFD